jgi:hypothetical protein
LLNCKLRSSFVIGVFDSELGDPIISDDDGDTEAVDDEETGVVVDDEETGVVVDELLESPELDIFSGLILDFVESLEDVEDSTINNFFFCGIPDIILIY